MPEYPSPQSNEAISYDEGMLLPTGEETEPQSKLVKYLDQGNIVDQLPDNQEATFDSLELYNEADTSMRSWRKKYKRAINLAKLQAMSGDKEIDKKNFPFEGASLVMMPYILEAMLDFSSRASTELVWSKDIVRGKIYGKNNEQKEERAKRVGRFSNYQLTELIPNWRDNQDKGLFILASPGTFYKKIYWDTDAGEVRSELCMADEVVFDQGYKCFDAAPHKFYKCKYTRNEVISYIRGEQAWDMKEDDLEEDKEEFDFIEAYTWFDLDGDGLREPYLALIWEEKQRIVSLYPRYDEDTITESEDGTVIKIDEIKSFVQYRFLPDPEGGPMGMGWGILLGPMFDSINTNVRQLIDSGTLANAAANSGLISQSLASGRGNAVQSGPIEVQLGQLTPVPFHGTGRLSDSIVQFPFAGPNNTLFKLMEYLIQSSRQMTNAAINVEAQPGEAATLYLARLQQGLKIPNSIIMRVYECAKREFQLIASYNYKKFDDEKYNKIIDSEQQASMQADFNPDDCDIVMVSDPSHGSDIERAQRAQAVYQMAVDQQEQQQQVINHRQAVIELLEIMRVPNLEKLAPEPDPNYVDPMQKMMLAERQMEAEMRQRDQKLREGELRVKESKAALEATKAMNKAGLDADKQEAEITKLYTDALKNLADIGIANGEQKIKQIEAQFIDTKRGTRGGQIQASNAGTV